MKIHFADSSYKIDPDFVKNYITEVENAYEQVSKLLPFGSKHLNFFVQPREHSLVPETEDAGYTVNSEFVTVAFNPTAGAKALGHVKGTVFHEMNHAARYNIPIFHKEFIDNCIMEGLATVFAREHAGYDAPWSHYPADVADWIKEIIRQGAKIDRDQYMYEHADGRRWIGYKIGTHIVDESIKNSDKTIIDLTQMKCGDILCLAKININSLT